MRVGDHYVVWDHRGAPRAYRVLRSGSTSAMVREVRMTRAGKGFRPSTAAHDFSGSRPFSVRVKGGAPMIAGMAAQRHSGSSILRSKQPSGQGPVQTGKKGGKYVVTPSGKKVYLGSRG